MWLRATERKENTSCSSTHKKFSEAEWGRPRPRLRARQNKNQLFLFFGTFSFPYAHTRHIIFLHSSCNAFNINGLLSDRIRGEWTTTAHNDSHDAKERCLTKDGNYEHGNCLVFHSLSYVSVFSFRCLSLEHVCRFTLLSISDHMFPTRVYNPPQMVRVVLLR